MPDPLSALQWFIKNSGERRQGAKDELASFLESIEADCKGAEYDPSGHAVEAAAIFMDNYVPEEETASVKSPFGAALWLAIAKGLRVPEDKRPKIKRLVRAFAADLTQAGYDKLDERITEANLIALGLKRPNDTLSPSPPSIPAEAVRSPLGEIRPVRKDADAVRGSLTELMDRNLKYFFWSYEAVLVAVIVIGYWSITDADEVNLGHLVNLAFLLIGANIIAFATLESAIYSLAARRSRSRQIYRWIIGILVTIIVFGWYGGTRAASIVIGLLVVIPFLAAKHATRREAFDDFMKKRTRL